MSSLLKILSMLFIAINPLIAAIHHYDFKGTSQAIDDQHSPVRGKILLLTSVIPNIRFFMEGSQDPYFRLVKMLFPSNGATLATTAQTTYNFGKSCTSPTTVAKLIKFADSTLQQKPYSAKERQKLIEELARDSSHQKANLKKYKKHTIAPLLEAIENAIAVPEHIKTFYNSINVIDIIHAFFCFHFNTRAELGEYIEAITTNHLEGPRFTPEEREQLQDKEYLNLEEQVVLALGNLSEKSPYPHHEVLISNDDCPAFDRTNNCFIEKKSFADCVETAFRHFFNILFFDSASRSFILDHIQEKHRTLLFTALEDFYAHQPADRANDGSRELRGLFNKITGDLNDNNCLIGYRKKNKYNIKSGFINFISVINRIFNLSIDIKSLNEHNLYKAFEMIIEEISRHKNYTIELENLIAKNGELYGELRIDMGDEDTFIIEVSECHTETELCLSTNGDQLLAIKQQFSDEILHIFMSKAHDGSTPLIGKLADNDARLVIIRDLLQQGPPMWGEHRDLIQIYLSLLLASLSWSDDHVRELFREDCAPLLNSMSKTYPERTAHLLSFVQHASFAYSTGLKVRLLPFMRGLKWLVIEDGELLDSLFIDGHFYNQLELIKIDTHAESCVTIQNFDGALKFSGATASSVILANCSLSELKAPNLTIKDGKAELSNVAIRKMLSCDRNFLDISQPTLDLSMLQHCIIATESALELPLLAQAKKLEIKIKQPARQNDITLSFKEGIFAKLETILISLSNPWARSPKPTFTMHVDARQMPALKAVKNERIYPKNFSWLNSNKVKELPCCESVDAIGEQAYDIHLINTPNSIRYITNIPAQLSTKALRIVKSDVQATLDLSAFQKIGTIEIMGGGILKHLTLTGIHDFDIIYCTSIKQYGDSLRTITIKGLSPELHEKMRTSLLKNRMLSIRQINFIE